MMTKADYIRNMSDEQLVDMCDDAEKEIMISSCNREYCEYSREDGKCDGVSKGGCRIAIKNWLKSEVKEGRPWYE